MRPVAKQITRRAVLAGALGLGAATAAWPGGEPLYLDRNENPLGPGPRVRALLAGAGATAGRYPEPAGDPVRRALARHHGLPGDCLVPTCGSVEAIEIAFRELVREGDRVATLAPVFQLVPPLAGQVGGVVVPVGSLGDLSRARARVIFVANPHNPTGALASRAKIEALIAPGVTLIVDEAYLPYADESQSLMPRVGQIPDLIVLRTLSKAHGLAGLRVGYAAAAPALAARLARHRLRNGVGALAELAVPAALADTAHLRRVIALNARARALLTRGFEGFGWRVSASEANFVLAEVGARAAALEQALAARGVLVHRPADRPDCLRVTTGTLPQMDRLLGEMKKAGA